METLPATLTRHVGEVGRTRQMRHVAEVEIDPDTGVIDIQNYVAVDDCGRVINHTLLEGQTFGGIVQGIGQVLVEHCVYDENGQLLTGSFMDYAMPKVDI